MAYRKKQKKTLTLKDKMEILNMIDNGEKFQDIAEHFGIGLSTIYDVKVRRSGIMSQVNICDKRRTLRRGKYPELDKALYKWFLEQRAEKIPLNGDIMRDKSKELYKEITGKEFCASSGWVDKFKKRFGIKFNTSKIFGDIPSLKSPDELLILEFVESFKDKIEKLGLVPDQLYSVEASSVSTQIICNKNDTNEERGTKIERVTFMPCSNATGIHKLNLIIGKEPLNDVKSAGCYYKDQTNAWATKDIFSEWFHEDFVPAVRSFMDLNNLPEKALLVLDEAPGYPEDFHLKSNDWMIQAMFLPVETSHLFNPMDRNLMEVIKTNYKNKTLLNAMAKDGDLVANLKNIGVSDIVTNLTESWNSFSENHIRKCWKRICPDIEVSEDIGVDNNIEEIAIATQNRGIDESAVIDWLSGKKEAIYIEAKEVQNVKSEDSKYPISTVPIKLEVV